MIGILDPSPSEASTCPKCGQATWSDVRYVPIVNEHNRDSSNRCSYRAGCRDFEPNDVGQSSEHLHHRCHGCGYMKARPCADA